MKRTPTINLELDHMIAEKKNCSMDEVDLMPLADVEKLRIQIFGSADPDTLAYLGDL